MTSSEATTSTLTSSFSSMMLLDGLSKLHSAASRGHPQHARIPDSNFTVQEREMDGGGVGRIFYHSNVDDDNSSSTVVVFRALKELREMTIRVCNSVLSSFQYSRSSN
ncbi:hypothetical protein ZOSMA_20G00880 [Zostera marina]|uniref:Uncharacterized protein n=1 Tax=Zostera marina TaxID=29655 RepID=A0A0K9PN24_ZOSMR|nr:hypothetical protein ZOSMA_20G00880 [Zostera marina]